MMNDNSVNNIWKVRLNRECSITKVQLRFPINGYFSPTSYVVTASSNVWGHANRGTMLTSMSPYLLTNGVSVQNGSILANKQY